MKKIRILIVDDHRLFREAWAQVLNSERKFHVVGETGLTELAIVMAIHLKPDIVFISLNSSPIEGFELTKRITNAAPEAFVVAMCTDNKMEFAKKMFSLGAKGYVTKNSSIEEISDCIIEVKEGRKYICRELKELVAETAWKNAQPEPDINLLTKREVFIIQQIVSGQSSKDIAGKLQLSASTINASRTNILKKLNLKNTTALIHYSVSLGLQPVY
jgi:DNA-binding NarL/FixJ family response regulator